MDLEVERVGHPGRVVGVEALRAVVLPRRRAEPRWGPRGGPRRRPGLGAGAAVRRGQHALGEPHGVDGAGPIDGAFEA